jgi:Rrf2 family protein
MPRSLPQSAHSSRLLTGTAEYALRALAALADCAPGESLRTVDLARRTGVPEAYLAKVLRRLVSHDILRATKGHGGGFALARSPDRICFVDVLEAVDSMPLENRCAFGRPRCSPADPCALHPVWSRLKEAFLDWARSTTLADVGTVGVAREDT